MLFLRLRCLFQENVAFLPKKDRTELTAMPVCDIMMEPEKRRNYLHRPFFYSTIL
jgi:hypothetical protein